MDNFNMSFTDSAATADLDALNTTRVFQDCVLMSNSRDMLDLHASEILPMKIGSKRTVTAMVEDQVLALSYKQNCFTSFCVEVASRQSPLPIHGPPRV